VHQFNRADQNGADGHPVTIVDGIRQGTAMAYLTAEVRARPNLTIHGGLTVDRVLFAGTTAVGVVAANASSTAPTRCSWPPGSYGSAALLLRSGVGPAADLAAPGIEVVADLPVGRRLQDHPFYNAYALAPGDLEMSSAIGSLPWKASSEAVGDELDLHITVSHLLEGSHSRTADDVVLATAVV
jgi:choline dehydrogenase